MRWRKGMIDGLWDAYKIIEENIHIQESGGESK